MPPGSAMSHAYDYRLVALSVVIAMAAAYVALDLAGRTTAARGKSRPWWLLGGALSMGVGIWSMHYIGMLAFSLPVPVLYDLPTVVVSLLAAVLASGAALFVVSRARFGIVSATIGSLTMGSGVGSMHYIGMAAMRMQGIAQWNYSIVSLSIVIAVVVSLVALWLAFRFRAEQRPFAPLKLASAAVMGFAVAGMHYTGMAAATFQSSGIVHDMTGAVNVSTLGVAGITGVTFMVLGLAIVTSIFEASLNFSVLRCVPLPMPAKAKLILPGLVRASASRSATDFSFEDGWTMRTFGWPTSGMMSTKSCTVS